MKACVRHEYGTSEVLRLEEVKAPRARDDELLVKVRAASCNLGDWEILTGRPRYITILASIFGPMPRVRPPSPPGTGGWFEPRYKILGCDIAGSVEAIGRDATGFAPGDEVFGLCSFGAFAEYVCVKAKHIARKPPGLSFEQAASLPQATYLAVQGLRDTAPVKPGQKVLINGAGGGAGTLAVQLAKSMEAEVTAVDNGEKLELMRSIGADQVIDYAKDDYTNSGRYDLIFDLAAHRPLSDCRRALVPGGVHMLAGGGAGPTLSAMLLAPLISRFSDRKVIFLMARENANDLLYMARLVEAGTVRPIIDRIYPLERAPEAIQRMGEGHALGKLVITI